jgi:hypothetical protein
LPVRFNGEADNGGDHGEGVQRTGVHDDHEHRQHDTFA